MTRREIRNKYKLSMIENPLIADRELSADEAIEYERLVRCLVNDFNKSFKNRENDDGLEKI